MRMLAVSLMAALMAGSAVAQTPTPSTSLAPPANAPPPHPVKPGPLKVAIEAPPSLMTHTVYRPEGGAKLPIVAWGNGACSNAGLLFSTFLTQVASHGYLVIASGPKDGPLPAFARQRPGQAATPAGTVPAGRT